MNLLGMYQSFLLALCIWREARGESAPGKAGVLSVIRNRVADKRWPDTIAGVILQPRQFSSFNMGDVNASKLPDPSDRSWGDCCALAAAPETVADPTAGATHYESIPDPAKRPSWAMAEKMTVSIGAFRFYKL